MQRNISKKGKMIYIGNLKYNIDEKELAGIFRKFGKVKEVNLVRIPKTEKSKGIAFVNMFKADEADKAIKSLNGKIIDGRTVKVSEAIEGSENEKKVDLPFKKVSVPPKTTSRVIKKKNNSFGLNHLFENIRKIHEQQ